MAALTAGRAISERPGNAVPAGLAATTKIFQGSLVCLNAAGNMVKGATALNLKALGVAADEYDNSTGNAGDVVGVAKKGIYPFANSTAGDAITKADIGATAYIVDDQTVAKTDGTGTRSAAGKVFDVDSFGVWIDLR